MKKQILSLTILFVVFLPFQSVAYSTSIGIEENDEVNLHYALTFDGVLDQEDDFTTVVNNDNLIEGFYLNILGMKAGEEKSFVVPPDQGYPLDHPKLGGKILYFDVEINEIVTNVRGDNYVPPVQTVVPTLFDFAEDAGTGERESIFQNFISSPLVLAFSITGLVLFTYIKLTDGSSAEKVIPKKSTPTKLTAQEKLRKRMEEMDNKEY